MPYFRPWSLSQYAILGVSQLAVAVNKLDTVDWSQQRFEDIQNQLTPFLKQTGFSDCAFVPCCGASGDNLTSLPAEDHPLRTWYNGPCLLEIIGKKTLIAVPSWRCNRLLVYLSDNFKPPDRGVDRPLRLCVSDVYKGMTAGFFVTGKVETGALQAGDKVSVMPSCETAGVKSKWLFVPFLSKCLSAPPFSGIQNYEGVEINAAYAGDQCVLSLVGIDPANISVGDVICHPENLTPTTTRFEARVVFFNLSRPVTKGSQVRASIGLWFG